MKTIKKYMMQICVTLFIASLLTLLVGITDISKTSDYLMDASVLLMGVGILLPCIEDIVKPQN